MALCCRFIFQLFCDFRRPDKDKSKTPVVRLVDIDTKKTYAKKTVTKKTKKVIFLVTHCLNILEVRTICVVL